VGKANVVQMVFVKKRYEHQFCFSHPWTRWATLFSPEQSDCESINNPIT
jgi:hypothetical protein